MKVYKLVGIRGEKRVSVVLSYNYDWYQTYSTIFPVHNALCFAKYEHAISFAKEFLQNYKHSMDVILVRNYPSIFDQVIELWEADCEYWAKIKEVLDPQWSSIDELRYLANQDLEQFIYRIEDHGNRFTAPLGTVWARNVKLVRKIGHIKYVNGRLIDTITNVRIKV